MGMAVQPRRRGRPPKSEEGFSGTREGLIRAGVAVLTEKGFSATGIDEILARLDVPKGSFYNYFGSKEAFGAELIDSYARYFADWLDREFSDDTRTPLSRLRAFTRAADAGMRRYRVAFNWTMAALLVASVLPTLFER